MKKILPSIPLPYLFILSVFLLLLGGCGNDSNSGNPNISNVTPVTLAFNIPVAQLDSSQKVRLAEQAIPTGLLNQGQEALGSLLIPNAFAAAVPVGINTIIVEISGPGMSIISDVITVTAGLLLVTKSYMVPSGADRTVSVTAVNAANSVLYQGSALIPLMEPGKAVSVPMQLLPTNPLTDTLAPVVTAPAPVTVAAVDASGTPATQANLVTFLNSAIATDNIGVISLTHNAPILFPVGVTTVTFTAIDAAGNSAIATSSVTISDQTPPQITLLGADPVTISQRSIYNDAGATALDNVDGDITANIVTTNPVNTATAGTYTVSYNVSDVSGNAATQVTRTVNVIAVDTTPPVITLLGTTPVTVTQGTTYVDAGATALDNVDGDITASIVTVNPVNTAAIGSSTVTYNVSDAAGNAATQVTRTVNVVAIADTTPPVITLLGSSPIDVAQGSTYTDAGATALDNVDGDITANIVVVDLVDTGTLGTTIVTYNVSDAAGNAATQVTRTVNVVAAAGTNWTTQNSNTADWLSSVIWNGSKFVTVGAAGTIRTSWTGLNWAVLPSNTSNQLNGLAWNGSQFIAVGANGTILFSTDGSTWFVGTSGTTNQLNGVVWSAAQSHFVSVGGTGTIIASPDGTNWYTQVSNSSSWLYAVTWGGSQFVSVGSNITAGPPAILTSPDVFTWTNRTSNTFNYLAGVTWGGTQFVAVGAAGEVLTSPDGIIWTAQTSGTTNQLNAITWSGSLFVAVGFAGTIITSTDGVNWTTRTSGTVNQLNGVTWNGTKFVVVGDLGTILTSQ